MRTLRLKEVMRLSHIWPQVAKAELGASPLPLSSFPPSSGIFQAALMAGAHQPASPPALCGCFASCWIPEVSGLIRGCAPSERREADDRYTV